MAVAAETTPSAAMSGVVGWLGTSSLRALKVVARAACAARCVASVQLRRAIASDTVRGRKAGGWLSAESLKSRRP